MASVPLAVAGRVDYGMSADDYHAIDALGSSDVKRLLRSPAHFKAGRDEPREPSDAQQLGTAIHLGVLEPERFEREVALSPKFDRRTKDGKAAAAAFEAEHAGKHLLSADDFDLVRRCVDAVHAHPAAGSLLQHGVPEVSLRWPDAVHGVACKARLDWLRPDGGIVDLKSAIDASPGGFARAIGQFGYALQCAHYQLGAEAVLAQAPYFAFIAVEKEPPFAVGVYVLDPESVEAARERVRTAYARYQECAAANAWPAYSPLIETINAPRWAL